MLIIPHMFQLTITMKSLYRETCHIFQIDGENLHTNLVSFDIMGIGSSFFVSEIYE